MRKIVALLVVSSVFGLVGCTQPKPSNPSNRASRPDSGTNKGAPSVATTPTPTTPAAPPKLESTPTKPAPTPPKTETPVPGKKPG